MALSGDWLKRAIWRLTQVKVGMGRQGQLCFVRVIVDRLQSILLDGGQDGILLFHSFCCPRRSNSPSQLNVYQEEASP